MKWRGLEGTKELAAGSNAKIVIIGAGKDGLLVILGSGSFASPGGR